MLKRALLITIVPPNIIDNIIVCGDSRVVHHSIVTTTNFLYLVQIPVLAVEND